MSHLVKCKYCNKSFDADTEPFVKIGRRYAHQSCAENISQEQKDLESLENYIMQLFDEPYINLKIENQIKEYHEKYNYTYSGILKTLVYWYEVKGNSTEQARGGIGIVPYTYDAARDYYYELYLAQTINDDKDINEYVQPKVKTVVIPPPFTEKRKHKLFFDFDKEK